MRQNGDELEELFEDAEDLRLARLLSRMQAPRVEADPTFRASLRRQVMREAWDMANPSLPWWRQLFAPRAFAWGGAVAGLVAVAALAVLFGISRLQTAQSPSAQINDQPVASTQAINVSFNTEMDHTSVEKAIKIDPPTDVRYQWDGNTLHILPPADGWANNVQYKVTVDQSAQSTSGKSLAQTATAPVVAQATPTPTPTATPTPTPTVTPVSGLTDQRQIGEVAGDHRFAAFSQDGQTLYVIDSQRRLSAVPTQTGQGRVLTDGGVSTAALSPDGSALAFVRAGKVWTVPAAGGNPASLASAEGEVQAIGWRDGAPIWVAGDAIFTPSGQSGHLAAAAQQASFSPGGDHLAYQSAGGLKSVDLGSGNETSLVQSTTGRGTLLAWSPDGRWAVYQDGGQVVAVDLSGSGRSTANLQATAAAFSAAGNILLATAQGLYEVRSDGSGQRMLAAGTFDLLTWAPDGVRVAYVRGTALWLGQVVTPGAGGTGSTLESARATVDAFMRARVAANADQASSQLDATASAAYGTDGLQLTSSGLTRYYVVAAQQFPAGPRFVVRLIFSKDKFETQYLDETLTLQTDSQGKLLIHTASASPKQDLGKGPLVTSVDVAPGVVKLQFDSDLDAKSVAGAVVVSSGLGSQPQATVSFQGNRTVLVDTSQLTAGATYHLTVQTSLKDVNGRAVPTAYQVDVIALKPTS